MQLREYAGVARRRWRVGLSAALLVLGATGAWLGLTSSSYSSTTVLFASVDGTGTSANAYNNMLVAQQRVRLYADLATGTQVADGVVRALKLPLTARQVQAKLKAEAKPDAAVVSLTASDSSPTRARDIAAAAAVALTDVGKTLDGPVGAHTPAVLLKVVEPAQVPNSRSTGRIGGIALGALLALVMAAVAMAVREVTDARVRVADDLIRAFDLDVAAVVPHDGTLKNDGMGVAAEDTPRAESLHVLRSRLQVLRGDGAASITIAGTRAGDGASTVAVTLAASLARAQARVVVVDADLRQPRVDRYLGVRGNLGLAEVLAGRQKAAQLVVESRHSGVWALPAGSPFGRVGDLLDHDRLAAVVADLEETFDFVVIDTPPVLAAPDAAVIGAVTDGVVLVVRERFTQVGDVDRALRVFRSSGAPLLGAVINNGREPSESTSYPTRVSVPVGPAAAVRPRTRRR